VTSSSAAAASATEAASSSSTLSAEQRAAIESKKNAALSKRKTLLTPLKAAGGGSGGGGGASSSSSLLSSPELLSPTSLLSAKLKAKRAEVAKLRAEKSIHSNLDPAFTAHTEQLTHKWTIAAQEVLQTLLEKIQANRVS